MKLLEEVLMFPSDPAPLTAGALVRNGAAHERHRIVRSPARGHLLTR